MATRDKRTSGTKSGPTTTATTTDAVEQRVLAFAEQIGRIAGTIQAKAEGWMNREALDQQIASVRDGAADLLERLASTTKATKKAPSRAGPRRPVQARGRGPVDAPGKKHRTQPPKDPDAKVVASQEAKMRTAMTMVKTNRRRGRG